jgi:hypothetical protein
MQLCAGPHLKLVQHSASDWHHWPAVPQQVPEATLVHISSRLQQATATEQVAPTSPQAVQVLVPMPVHSSPRQQSPEVEQLPVSPTQLQAWPEQEP